jgi:hypothetical protein
MTECTQETFEVAAHFSRRVLAEFSADRLTTDGGSPLLRQVDRRIGLLRRFAGCFLDRRDPSRIEHSLAEMIAQRVYALALGYEDLNDHEQLRHDPLLGLLAGKRELDSPLAGKSTLNRLELSRADESASRYHKVSYSSEKIDHLLVDLFLESHSPRPRRIVLDLDSTDIPLHGHQERRFFHGYYNSYCYLPLYIFAGDHLLCARLRPADQDGAAEAVSEVERIVSEIRQRWPRVEIVVRADSGFCREDLMNWCEQHRVDYILGLARNERLRKRLERQMREARRQYEATGRAARLFTEFSYRTHKSWSRWRRVIAKAEYIPGKENPRFVVTSLSESTSQSLYEKLYCARGEMENRIKEQLCLFADRLSTATMRANQLRLYLSAMAYTLLEALRRLALRGTEWAEAQVDTLRLRLLKVAAQVQISARRIRLLYSAAYPWKLLFAHAWAALRC